ncbi:MAG: flavin reductase [Bacteroidota bacterium]
MAEKKYSRSDIEEMPKQFRRNFVNCLSGYKSVGLCGTINMEGQTNLSIISSMVHIGADPSLMGMVMRPHVVERHTIENIDQTGFFTLNHISESFFKKAHQTSARYPREESEFQAVGLTEEYGELVPAPYVKESPLKLGFQFKERHRITTNATTFIIGQLMEVILPEEALGDDGFIYLEKVGSLTVSGLDRYHRASPINRLTYAKPDRKIKEI